LVLLELISDKPLNEQVLLHEVSHEILQICIVLDDIFDQQMTYIMHSNQFLSNFVQGLLQRRQVVSEWSNDFPVLNFESLYHLLDVERVILHVTVFLKNVTDICHVFYEFIL
jgi:hypothetical protein